MTELQNNENRLKMLQDAKTPIYTTFHYRNENEAKLGNCAVVEVHISPQIDQINRGRNIQDGGALKHTQSTKP